jgi:hypothetical protein
MQRRHNQANSAEIQEVDESSNHAIEVRVLSLDTASVLSLSSEANHPDTPAFSRYMHIYDVLENANKAEDLTVVCYGLLTRQNLVTTSDESIIHDAAADEKSSSEILISGRYEVILYIDDQAVDETTTVFVVGKILIDLEVSDASDMPPSSHPSDDILNNLLNSSPLPVSFQDYLSSSECLQRFERLSIDECIAILSCSWSRLLAVLCKNSTLTDYISLLEIPFGFLMEDEIVNKSVDSVAFWQHEGEDTPTAIYCLLTSIISAIIRKPEAQNHNFIAMLSDRMMQNSSITVLWLYVENWMTSKTLQTLIDHSKFRIEISGGTLQSNDSAIDLSIDEWNKFRCVALCLQVLRAIESRETNDVQIERDSSQASDSVASFAEELLTGALSYVNIRLKEVSNHIAQWFHDNDNDVRITNKSSSRGNKSKIQIDHERRQLEEKYAMLQASYTFLHEIITLAAPVICDLSNVVVTVSIANAKSFDMLVKMFVGFASTMFDEYVTINDIERWSHSASDEAKAQSVQCLSKAELDDLKVKQFDARLVLLDDIRLIFAIHRHFLSTACRLKDGNDVFRKPAPAKWEKKGYLNQDPNSMNKQLTSISESLANPVFLLASLLKKYHRHFVVSSFEYHANSRVGSALLDIIDAVFAHELSSIVAVIFGLFDHKFTESTPMEAMIAYVGERTPLLKAVINAVEANLAWISTIMTLPSTNRDNSSRLGKQSFEASSISTSSSPYDISLLQYLSKNTGSGHPISNLDLRDDELMIANIIPNHRLIRFMSNFLSILFPDPADNSSSYDSMKASFEKLAVARNDDVIYFFVLISSCISEGVILIWQLFDLQRLQEQSSSIVDRKMLSNHMKLARLFYQHESYLSILSHFMFNIIQYDNDYFVKADIDRMSNKIREIRTHEAAETDIQKQHGREESVGLKSQEVLYGSYYIINQSSSVNSLIKISDANINDMSLLSCWLYLRYTTMAALGCLLRYSSTVMLIDCQHLIPATSIDYTTILEIIDILTVSVPRIVSSIKSLAECDRLKSQRPDILTLCTHHEKDTEFVLRSCFDYACFIPVFEESSYRDKISSIRISYEPKSTQLRRTGTISPTKIAKNRSKMDLVKNMSSYYAQLEDCRYQLILTVMKDITSTPHVERIFNRLLFTAVLSSLPADSLSCFPAIASGIFSDQISIDSGSAIYPRYKNPVFKRGSAQVLQSIYGLLELSSSLESSEMSQIRYRLYTMLSSLQCYVLGKMILSLRFRLSKDDLHDIYKYDRIVSVEGMVDLTSDQVSEKAQNLLASRFDVLSIIAALHSFLRSTSASTTKSNITNLDHCRLLLKELQSFSSPRLRDTKKGDIRLLLPNESSMYDSTNYLDIFSLFSGKSKLSLIPHYDQLSATGLLTDSIEELGLGFITSQLSFQFSLIRKSNQMSLSLVDFNKTMTSSAEIGNAIRNFTIEEQEQIHGIERHHALARQLIHSMEGAGNWESAMLFAQNIIDQYNKEENETKRSLTGQSQTSRTNMSPIKSSTSATSSPATATTTGLRSSLSPGLSLASSPTLSGMATTSYQSYLQFRCKSLIKELHTVQDRLRQRLAQEGEVRLYPLYYALRCSSILSMPHDIKVKNDLVDHLQLKDFLVATNLSFIGLMVDPIDTSMISSESVSSLVGLGQGSWILLRYDPTAFISSARFYQSYVDCHVKYTQQDDYVKEADRLPVPLPPPSYAAILTKLQQSFPNHRILSSHHYVEHIDSKSFAFVPDGKLTNTTSYPPETPTIQLFEAFPACLCNDDAAKQFIEKKITDMNKVVDDENVVYDGASEHQQLQQGDEAEMEGVSSEEIKHSDNNQKAADGNDWIRSSDEQSFFIFAFEDENREHFYRSPIGHDDIDYPLSFDKTERTPPRIIRYTLTINSSPLDAASGWLAPVSIAFIKQCKAISITHSLAQLLQYYEKIMEVTVRAVEHILSLSSKEYQRQQPDGLTHSDTLLVGCITALANAYMQPGASCIGLHNVDSLVSRIRRSLF